MIDSMSNKNHTAGQNSAEKFKEEKKEVLDADQIIQKNIDIR